MKMNGHYDQLVILVIFQAIESNMFWLQLPKCKDLLLFFVINVCKSFLLCKLDKESIQKHFDPTLF